MKTIDIDKFTENYLHTAAWITCDSGENTEFTKLGKEYAKKDCLEFIELVTLHFGTDKANQLLTIAGNDFEYLAAHDLFLTRNGHGAGFWDKENYYGESEAVILSDIARKMGSADCIHERGKKSKLTFF